MVLGKEVRAQQEQEGVIRGDKGEWVIGFSENLGDCLAIKAEIRAVLRSLKLAKEVRTQRLWIQIDF